MASRSINKYRPSFKQQNLPAWQPILTAGTVLPTFFLIGVAFVPIGIGLLMSSTTVQEKIIDYTDCKSQLHPDKACSSLITRNDGPCSCKIDFHLEEDFRKEVYVYYGLSNFFQNHRRYVKSRDDYQLLGNPKSVNSDCAPFDYVDGSNGSKVPIAPCGAIANSFFNDSFELRKIDTEASKRIVLSEKGIAWPTDKQIRFQNPLHPDGLQAAFDGTAKPPNWRIPVWNLSLQEDNAGFQNEHLIVWMRTAALPTFRKLWATVNLKATFFSQDLEHLPGGNYSLIVQYNYPVTSFQGRKRFILSNTSWLGGKNHFLGIAYIVVGAICFALSALFLYIHKKYGRLPSEITQITQTTPYLRT